MKKVSESIRSLIAAALLICCLLNLWLALGVLGLIFLYAGLRWLFQPNDLAD